jgi:hypothetical protein
LRPEATDKFRHGVTWFTLAAWRLGFNDGMEPNCGGNAMCDLAYVNLLREKVRQLESEEKHFAAHGATHHERFVPWVMPASQLHDESERLQADRRR